MDDWGDINEPQDDDDQLWGGDISDNNGDGDDRDEPHEYVATFDQEVAAQSSKDFAKSCGDPIPFSIKPGTKEYAQAISSKTPLERFKLDVDYVSRILNEYINLSVQDRNKMCERADYTNILNIEPKYLNALAYVLGYIANKNNAVINLDDSSKDKKEKIKNMRNIIGSPDDNFQLLQSINDEASKARSGNVFAVYPPDVIRYAQMWAKLS